MHFCTICQNMYYIRIQDDSVVDENTSKLTDLVYYCRNCGNEEKNVDDICISKTQIKKSEQSFGHIINKYTKLDPTLPRISKILCPNSQCETNTKDAKREIIYIRYDDVKMKYIYLCSTCDTVWKTNEEK